MEFDDLFKAAGSLRRGNLHYLPVVPGRMEFALEVRRAILSEKPDVVAVELPASFQTDYLRAVRRLPEMTVLVYPDPPTKTAASSSPSSPQTPLRKPSAALSRSMPRSSSSIPTWATAPICRTAIRIPTHFATLASKSTSKPTASTLKRARRKSKTMPPASRGSFREPIPDPASSSSSR
ncbi:MAG TPA: hypothetical protein VN428_11515 [Bryobacteraceae bacterium]|nr:hypothetical protein [Bryobacteraceae bacterium]